MEPVTPATLTRTQQRIVGLICGGRSNAEIARQTGLSAATVKWHVSEVLSKLGLASRHEAGEWWRERHGVRRKLWRTSDMTLEPTGGAPVEATLHRSGADGGFSVSGTTLAIEEWAGSAPGELHVHHARDIAWHVISGSLSFRLETRRINVAEGETLFIPAGVAHTYGEGEARYLVIASPELFQLFQQLREARIGRPHTDWGLGPDREIYRRHDSELLDMGDGRPLP